MCNNIAQIALLSIKILKAFSFYKVRRCADIGAGNAREWYFDIVISATIKENGVLQKWSGFYRHTL
jgi:hypothetical protein